MKKITINLDLEFANFINSCGKIDNYDLYLEKAFKSFPKMNKIMEKKILDSKFIIQNFYNNKLSYIVKNDLNIFFKNISVLSDYLYYISLQNRKLEDETLSDLIKYVQLKLFDNNKNITNFTTGNLYKAIKQKYDVDDCLDDFNKSAEIIYALLNDNIAFNIKFKNTVSEIKELFLEHIFLPNQDKYMLNVEKHNKLYEADSNNFINSMFLGFFNDYEETKTNNFIVTFFAVGVLKKDLSSKTIIYSFDIETIASINFEDDLIINLLKFISDPKRYKMLQRLKDNSCYANELAKEFKLTPATMSYHVNKLYLLGIISAEAGEQNKIYLKLNKSRLEYLLNKVKLDLLS